MDAAMTRFFVVRVSGRCEPVGLQIPLHDLSHRWVLYRLLADRNDVFRIDLSHALTI
jgi:hypothetical protein